MSESESKDWRGLKMASPLDAASLAEERAILVGLEGASFGKRVSGYARLLGPGYLQSAMTLGGGTISSALFAGALFGYELLWVAPVSMAMGLCMLAAVSWQTLSTGERPWPAMRRHAGPVFAWAWAIGALLSSIIWQFPQYALSSAVLVDLFEVAGFPGFSPMAMGGLVLVWAIGISNLYGRSPGWVRAYERLLQVLVWGIVVCFGWVVFSTGVSDWNAILRGFFTFQIPDTRNGIAGATLILSGLSAAVGVNMVFLYPYTMLARGWGREHRSLARFDLLLGMFIPYTIAVSLVVIATANTLHLDPSYDGTKLSAVQAANVFASAIGPVNGRFVFGLGVLGMALSSITLQMITCGFVGVELFGYTVGSWKHRLATWLPIPGVLGCVYWSDVAVWVAVPTNIICGLFLPAAYVGFCILQRSRAYLGSDRPGGVTGVLWFAGMVGTTAFLIAFFGWYVMGLLA